MIKIKKIFLSSLTLVSFFIQVEAEILKVNPAEQKQWLCHLLPLPHEIIITRKNVLNPEDISIKLRANAGKIEKNAASELKQLFKDKTGSIPDGQKFEIIIGVFDQDGKVGKIMVDGAERLKELPNNDQAYIIQSDKNGNRLLLTALNGKGIYYAVKTLCQLFGPALTKDQVSIPLTNVVDWPDFNERGMWNGGCDKLAAWLSNFKLNYARLTGRPAKFARNKKASLEFDPELMKKERLRAYNLVPDITHLNFLHHYGLFKAYPELHGKGPAADAGSYFAHSKGKKSHPVPCASHPLLPKILAELMEDAAAKGVTEMGCWLTERPAQCGCEKCLETGQFPLEAEAAIKAWQIVKKKYPKFNIRLFISTTTNEQYYKILKNLPKGVKIERACAAEQGRIRHSPRDLFRNPLFDSYAKSGVWMASYDVPIVVNGAVETPEFKVPESSAIRIKDFVSQLYKRGYSAAYGMFAWHRHQLRICGFNIGALAEWSWNVNGRSTKQFAEAWATLNGYEQPEKFAEWSEIMGPIEFDVYDSDFPVCYSWGKAVEMVKKGQYPQLGKVMFRYYNSPQSFDDKIEKCRQAEELAKTFKDKYFLYETQIVLSYAQLAKAVYQAALASYRKQQGGKTIKVAPIISTLQNAKKENVNAIRNWRTYLGKEKWHPRVNAAIKSTETTCDQIINVLKTK